MIIYANVKPGAKEERIERISENEFNIWVEERAEDNKANVRVMNILAKVLGVNAKSITIKTPNSRRKIIEVG
jgi:uncharacterized protein YggU (UPF0235/DUF167 family)